MDSTSFTWFLSLFYPFLGDSVRIFTLCRGGHCLTICRELTKLHEEVRRTTLGQAAAWYQENDPKGEFVLVVRGAERVQEQKSTLEDGLILVGRLRGEGPAVLLVHGQKALEGEPPCGLAGGGQGRHHLYLVPTPIGNLGDISQRMVEILELVDFIAAEDTRVTVKLLNHLGIKKPMEFLAKARGAKRTWPHCRPWLCGLQDFLTPQGGKRTVSNGRLRL